MLPRIHPYRGPGYIFGSFTTHISRQNPALPHLLTRGPCGGGRQGLHQVWLTTNLTILFEDLESTLVIQTK